MIPVAMAIGIAGLVIGDWLVGVAMACLILSQLLNVRASRRALGNRHSD
ncbi:MAG: hypothetical protein ACR2L9_12385 [Solirubrobacteraceae bacterium]